MRGWNHVSSFIERQGTAWEAEGTSSELQQLPRFRPGLQDSGPELSWPLGLQGPWMAVPGGGPYSVVILTPRQPHVAGAALGPFHRQGK